MCVNHFPQKPLVIVLVSPELFLVIDLVGEENRLLIVIVLVSPHHPSPINHGLLVRVVF